MKLFSLLLILIATVLTKAEVGHLSQIASYKEIPEVSVNANVFYNDYFLRGVPVMLRNTTKDIFEGNFDLTKLTLHPQIFTTYLEVKNKNDGSSKNVSLYQFINAYEDEIIYVDTPIPTVVKSQMKIPKILLCKHLTDNIQRTRLIIHSGEWTQDFEINSQDRIIFQLNGNSKSRLINATNEVLQAHLKSGLEKLNLDMVSEYFTAALVPGDSLFVPGGWAWQQNTTDNYISFSLQWNSDSETKPASTLGCGDQTETDLLTLSFPEDPPVDLLSVLEFEELHHFIKDYYLSSKSVDFQQFMTLLSLDDRLAGLPEWDEESKYIANEMFEQMDLNKNGILSKEDFGSTSREELRLLAGRIDDRLADFNDIIEDAKAEKKGSLFDEARKARGSDDIRKLIEDGFNELLGDIDAAKAEANAADDNTDSEMVGIKRFEKLLKDSIAQNTKDEL